MIRDAHTHLSSRFQQNLSKPCYRALMLKLRVWVDDCLHVLSVPLGANLRQVLLDACLTPYAPLTQKLNCGGHGICATCGVWLVEGEPEPTHWHDRIGQRFGYPRLSCQITVERDMTVRLATDKIIWGARRTPSTAAARKQQQV
jgi:ferredoxin